MYVKVSKFNKIYVLSIIITIKIIFNSFKQKYNKQIVKNVVVTNRIIFFLVTIISKFNIMSDIFDLNL